MSYYRYQPRSQRDISEVCTFYWNENGEPGHCGRSNCPHPHCDFARLYTASKLNALLSMLSKIELPEHFRHDIKQVMYGMEQFLTRFNRTINPRSQLNPNAINEHSPLQRSMWRVRSKVPDCYLGYSHAGVMELTLDSIMAYIGDKKESERQKRESERQKKDTETQQIHSNTTAIPDLQPANCLAGSRYSTANHRTAIPSNTSTLGMTGHTGAARHPRYFDSDQQVTNNGPVEEVRVKDPSVSHANNAIQKNADYVSISDSSSSFKA
jgi:hypothetical protein